MHVTFYAMRRAIQAFGKYVPKKVVQQLLAQVTGHCFLVLPYAPCERDLNEIMP